MYCTARGQDLYDRETPALQNKTIAQITRLLEIVYRYSLSKLASRTKKFGAPTEMLGDYCRKTAGPTDDEEQELFTEPRNVPDNLPSTDDNDVHELVELMEIVRRNVDVILEVNYIDRLCVRCDSCSRLS